MKKSPAFTCGGRMPVKGPLQNRVTSLGADQRGPIVVCETSLLGPLSIDVEDVKRVRELVCYFHAPCAPRLKLAV
jgi:hypothetical protein